MMSDCQMTIPYHVRPEENFGFINSYLKIMGPIVRRHNGFIDKYIGDAIIALFPGNSEDAVQAGTNMLKELKRYNSENRNSAERTAIQDRHRRAYR